jgi:uracil-DNA glycosylase family 4
MQTEPPTDCALCPRLVAYRADNAAEHAEWHNAPALPFGDGQARLLIVGLAPGRTGGNRTGRPFTGDFAGRMLFETLLRTGFATGTYADDGRDDVRLIDCRITNAVLCAPPGNRPTPAEETACRPYLRAQIEVLPRLRVIVTLGDVARRNLLKALGAPPAAMPAGHGATTIIGGYRLLNSFHCSRLNLNTGRLTAEALSEIFVTAKAWLDQAPSQ